MQIVHLKGAVLQRFLTPTEPWKASLYAPTQWPLMLVELLYDEAGKTLFSTATGVARTSVAAFRNQGVYFYPFDEIPAAVVGEIEQHFEDAAEQVRQSMDALMERVIPKPKLFIVR